MKNLLTIFVFIFVSNALLGQVEVELTIENQTVVGTDFFFDLYLTRTATNPGAGDLYLGNADFVLTFNDGNFTNPVLGKNPAASPGGCTFVPTDNSGLNPLFTQDQYFNNTALAISGNELFINLNGPTPSSQTVFDTRVAKIDQSPSTHRLGGFKISGISTSNGTAGLTWKTSGGGVVTQVFTLANTSPWASTAADIIATNPASFPLPVALTSISANANEKSIMVDWKSQSETNLSGYELQRSTDGSAFSKMAFLNAVGGEYAQEYSHEDKDVRPGITYYYRLKMIDEDGSFSFSPVRSAKIEGSALDEMTISPNPAKGHTYIEFDAPREGNYILELFNEKGGMVYQKNYDFHEGQNSILLNAGRFSNGTYLVNIKMGDEVVSGKLVLAGE